ncbi:MAG: hypothetical protein HUU23_10020 [Caldilineales bacterium]|nr:hypothetical protein [Caldilineales bacterium]
MAFSDDDTAPLGRESRRHLGELPRELRSRLAAIARDTSEDVDIRLQAVFWYVHHQREASLPLLRELRSDENPEVRAQAEDYLSRW